MNSPISKTKFYLTVGTITVIIVTAWILNLKNTLSVPDAKFIHNDKELGQISQNLSGLITELNHIKNSLAQSPTSTSTSLQPAAIISPETLDEVVSRLTTTTDDQIIDDAHLPANQP